tara:strand:- start:164 stop:679 length:516 start_codon:yes stop_codon:yes gene_type:complete
MKKISFIIFFLFFCTNIFAEDKIVYLDVNRLLNESEAGKYLNSELNKINNSNIEEFKKIENTIKSEEEKILKQKNILKTEEFNSKVDELRDKYKSYQDFKNNKNEEINKIRNDAGSKILKIVNEILSDYSTDKEISLIIEKKNIVIGKTHLDVTEDILKLLNKKIKKIEIN